MSRQQWIPLGFAILAAIICVVTYIHPGSDQARQGAFNIALALAGAAGGSYASNKTSDKKEGES